MVDKAETPSPADEGVTVELEPVAPVEIEIEAPKETKGAEAGKPVTPAAKPADEPELPLEVAVPTEAKEPDKPEKIEPAKPDPIVELSSQIEKLRAQGKIDRQAREAAEREVNTATNEAYVSKAEVAQARLHAIANAVAAEKNEAEIAEAAYAKALSESDFTEAAKQQRAMSRCEHRLADLDDGKHQLEAWLKGHAARKPEPRKPGTAPQVRQVQPAPTQETAEPETTGDPVEDYVAKQSPRVQQYLRGRDYKNWLSGPQSYKLAAAHNLALSEGYSEESNGYFSFIDEQMGIKNEKPESGPGPKKAVVTKKATVPSAPVSQKSGSPGALSNRTVTLSPQQQQAARDLGLSVAEYAKRVWMMKQPDWKGPKFGGN